MLFRTLALLLLLAVSAFSSALDSRLTGEEREWLRKHPVIRVAPDPDFAPIEWIDEQGDIRGIAADYIDIMTELLGIRFEVVACENWDEVLRKARSREVDMLSAAARSPRRSEFLRFSRPHIELPGVIITRTDVTEALDMEKLKNLRVSIVSGYVWQEFFEAEHPEIMLDLVPDVATGMKKVSFGLSDVMVENLATATQYLRSEGITNLRVAGETGYFSRLSFAVRDDWAVFHGILNKALETVPQSRREAIRDRWISIQQPSLLYDRSLWLALAVTTVITLGLVVGIIAWNRALKAQVDQRTAELKTELIQRKKAEDALQESQRKYKELVESANSIILKVDVEGTVLFFNEFAQRFFGYSAEEIIGRNVLGTIVPETETSGRDLRDLLDDVFANPQDYLYNENENMTRSGERKWIAWANRPIYDAHNALRQILCVGTDVTERRRARQALEESEQRYRFLFDEGPACNVVIGADGSTRDVNQAFLRELGYVREEIVGRDALEFIVPEARERMKGMLQKRFAGERVSEELDTPLLGKNGEVHYVNFAGSQTRMFEDGELSAILISGIDVTRKRKAEELARLQQEKLIQADKMATLGVLVSGVAHEINNPNNYIRLNSENLSDVWDELRPVLDEHAAGQEGFSIRGIPYDELCHQVNRLISGIGEGAERIAAIVKSLKDFARQEPGDMDGAVDCNKAVASSLVILSNMIRKATDRFQVNYGDGVPLARGNHQRIEQVIVNLVSNACQALTGREQSVEVTTLYDTDAGTIRVRVRDEGRGVSEEHANRIFDPFFTTKRDSGGTGLGLSIAYRIVKEHGGDLTFESRKNDGSLVEMVLPAEKTSRQGEIIT
jgi:PAS domain S-box-containing protein